MALRLEAGWNTAAEGTFSLSITDSAGTVVVSLPSGTYCHTDLTSALGSGNYDDAASAWQTALNASALNGTYTVSYSSSTFRYTIGCDENAAITLTGAEAVIRGMRSIGFAATSASATSHTSDVRPYYIIDTAMGAASKVSGLYERDGVTEEAEADDGTAYGESVAATTFRFDFEIVMETKAATFAESAAASAPWTWQHLFQHVRMREPLYFDDGTDTRVLQLRANATRFHPTPVAQDWDELWSVAFATRQLGTI